VVLMEALALGDPVVAPRVAGVPELVEDGVTGLLFTPADWRGLADALARLLGDAELRRRTGEAGRKKVEAEFEIDRASEAIYQRLVG
jgi:colanic acid/amylovoran biosynthesis glycosyltransferase